MDVVIPIVFPEYKISVATPPISVDIFPAMEFDNIAIPATKRRVSDLGHAGVLFINGRAGTTKYYEYGRYDAEALGVVRRVPLPNAAAADNKVKPASLKPVLRRVSRVAGQNGRLEGVYIEVPLGSFDAMLAYAEKRKLQNTRRTREPYSLFSNSCVHFAKQITEVAGVDTPWMVDPRPTSYAGEFRADFPDLDYRPRPDSLVIEGIGTF